MPRIKGKVFRQTITCFVITFKEVLKSQSTLPSKIEIC